MPWRISIQEQRDYIRVEALGERHPRKEKREIEIIWRPVAGVCRAIQKNLILAIYDVRGPLPTHAACSVIRTPKAFGWSRHFKLALVDLDEESRLGLLFVEEVAVSSGYQFRVFDNEQKAKAWLRGCDRT